MYEPNGISYQDIRINNRGRIFHTILSSDGLTRQEIVNRLNLSRPTVSKNVSLLEKSGLIYTVPNMAATGGRRAQIYRVNVNHRTAIGVDITPHQISAVMVNLSGEIIARKRIRCTFDESDLYYKKLGEIVQDVIQESRLPESNVIKVSIVLPALISPGNKKTYYTGALKPTSGMLTVDGLGKYIPYTKELRHDTSSSAFAESFVNHNLKDFFYLMLSNSVGGALILNRSPYAGVNNRCGEIGHMKLVPKNGKKCYCGKRGCMDAYCSGKALTIHTSGDIDAFFSLLANHDAASIRIWNDYIKYLAMSIVNARLLMDCDIVIGGAIGGKFEPYLSDLRRLVLSLDPFASDANYIHVCQFKTDASSAGAALHTIEEYIQSNHYEDSFNEI